MIKIDALIINYQLQYLAAIPLPCISQVRTAKQSSACYTIAPYLPFCIKALINEIAAARINQCLVICAFIEKTNEFSHRGGYTLSCNGLHLPTATENASFPHKFVCLKSRVATPPRLGGSLEANETNCCYKVIQHCI